MLSHDSSDETCASSPRTVYGSENEHGFPGMEVFFADQTPELVPAERLADLNQPERSPSNEPKHWLNFSSRTKNDAKNDSKHEPKHDHDLPADTKQSRNWRLWLLIAILVVGILIALAIALPLSLRPRGRESR